MSKIIPLLNRRLKKKKLEEIVEEGKVGGLVVRVFARGVLHITNSDESRMFKKDPKCFEEELSDIDFQKMNVGDSVVIEGSGDNDDLVFTRVVDNIKLALRRREFGVIKKFREILRRAKKIERKDHDE